MADHIPARIRIGGNLAVSLIGDLYDAVEEEGAGFEWGESGVGSLEEFTEALDAETALELRYSDASYGQFEMLEAFCRANDLTYVSDRQGALEHDAQVRWWAPGMMEPAETLGTQDGQPAILINDVQAALNGVSADRDRIAAVEALLDKFSPPEVPPFMLS
jgi:hypothetical protein